MTMNSSYEERSAYLIIFAPQQPDETNTTKGYPRFFAPGDGAQELYPRRDPEGVCLVRVPADRDAGHGKPVGAGRKIRGRRRPAALPHPQLRSRAGNAAEVTVGSPRRGDHGEGAALRPHRSVCPLRGDAPE